MNKDTFWTQAYRSGFIRGHYDCEEKREIIKVFLPNGETKQSKSLRGAKFLISKHIGGRPVK